MTVQALPDNRCPRCHALLFRGVLLGEIKCRKCDLVVTFR